MYRIGIGKDTHRLTSGKEIILGGITIPSEYSIVAYSDGDCLLHALIDALLGAIAKGDIGDLFSDKCPENKKRSSVDMLKTVYPMVKNSGYRISNIDCIIYLESPKLGDYKNQIKCNIAKVLSLDLDQINIKAKTNEGMAEIGKHEAIECFASVLVEEI